VNGSAVFTAPDATFVSHGYVKDDNVVISSGTVSGTYSIASVDSETQITLDMPLNGSYSEPVYGDDGTSVAGSLVFSSAESKFSDNGFVTGDRLIITSGRDIGSYTIANVISNTAISLTQSLSTTYADSKSANDGVTALGAATLTSASSGSDKGSYSINSILGETQISLNTSTGAAFSATDTAANYIAYYSDTLVQDRSDGVVSLGSKLFYSENATFIADGFKKDDMLVIKETGLPAAAGSYVIASVDTEHLLTLNTAAFGVTENSLSYSIFHGNTNVDFVAFHYHNVETAGADNSNVYSALDGVTLPASPELSSASSTFLSDGFEAGDIVTINSGADAGVYTIVSLTQTALTLDRPLENSYSGAYSGEDGIVEAGSDLFTSLGSRFEDQGFEAGDTLIITSGAVSNDIGFHVIDAVVNQTTLDVDTAFFADSLPVYLIFNVVHGGVSVDFSVFHVGETSVNFMAYHPAEAVNFTITSHKISADDAADELMTGKTIRTIAKVQDSVKASSLMEISVTVPFPTVSVLILGVVTRMALSSPAVKSVQV